MKIFPPGLAILGTVRRAKIVLMHLWKCFEAGGLTQTQSSAKVVNDMV